MHVVWTIRSLDRLSEIEEFIAPGSLQRALQFINLLIERGDSLKSNPGRGRIVPELSDPSIRELIVHNYRLVYRIGDDRIEILTVFEGHRLLNIADILKI